MSVNTLTDISVAKPQINCRCWDLIVDGDSTIHGSHFVDGDVTVNGTITINGSVSLPDGSLQIGDLSPGPPGNFLVTDSLGTDVVWSALPPIVVPPGPPDSIFQTNVTGGATQWNTNLIVPGTATVGSDLTVTGNTTSYTITGTASIESNGIMTSVGLLTARSNLQVDGDATINNSCTCSTLNATQIYCGACDSTGNINCGESLFVNNTTTCNDTLTVNSSSTLTGVVECGSDVTLVDGGSRLVANGYLTVAKNSDLQTNVNVGGNLTLASASGASGAVVYKTGPSTQSWVQLSTLIPSLVPSFRSNALYCHPDVVQNLNTGTGVRIQWSPSYLSSSFSSGPSLYIPISKGTASTWIVNTAGTYSIRWKVSLTGPGVYTSQVYTQAVINGAVLGQRSVNNTITAATLANTVTAIGEAVFNLAATNTIEVQGLRSVGTDILSTVIADSYIMITLLNTFV